MTPRHDKWGQACSWTQMIHLKQKTKLYRRKSQFKSWWEVICCRLHIFQRTLEEKGFGSASSVCVTMFYSTGCSGRGRVLLWGADKCPEFRRKGINFGRRQIYKHWNDAGSRFWGEICMFEKLENWLWIEHLSNFLAKILATKSRFDRNRKQFWPLVELLSCKLMHFSILFWHHNYKRIM